MYSRYYVTAKYLVGKLGDLDKGASTIQKKVNKQHKIVFTFSMK